MHMREAVRDRFRPVVDIQHWQHFVPCSWLQNCWLIYFNARGYWYQCVCLCFVILWEKGYWRSQLF